MLQLGASFNNNMNCLACGKVIKYQGEKLTCVLCKVNYHYLCLNITTATFNSNKTEWNKSWSCTDCSNVNRRKRGDDTPVRVNQSNPKGCSTENPVPSLSALVKDYDTTTMKPDTLNAILDKLSVIERQFSAIGMIQSDLSFIKNDVADLKQTLNAQLEVLSGRVNGIETRVEVLEKYKSDICDLKAELQTMRDDQRKNEQWVRRSNIQINGVPEAKGENLMNIVSTLATVSGFALNPNVDIDFVTRVAVKNDSDAKVTKPIILKMQSRYKKDDFISALRKVKNLAATHLGFHGNQNRVHINDHLSTFNKALLNKARGLAKEKGYAYCWVRNCTIMVRRTEKSPILFITSEESLKKIS